MDYSLRKNAVFILCLLQFCAYAQQTAVAYYDSIVSASISSEDKKQTIEAMLQHADTISLENQAHLNYEFSKWLFRNQNRSLATVYSLKELELRKKIGDQDLLKRNIYNLGYMHSRLDQPDYHKALHYLDTLISLTDETETRLGTLYREKGDIYDYLGDYPHALENYQNAERIQKQHKRNVSLVTTYINISGTYANLRDSLYFEDFFQNQKKLDALSEGFDISNEQRAILLMNEGNMYDTKRNYKNAFICYQKALELVKHTEDDQYAFGILNNLGVNCTKQERFRDAKMYLEQSELYSNNVRERKGIVLENLADLDIKQGAYASGLLKYKKAISFLLHGQTQSVSEELPTIMEVKVSPYKKYILEFLINLSQGYLSFYNATKDQTYLREASKIIELADLLIDDLYFESREDLSKLFWREKGADLYVMAVAICYELNDPERALYYMEKNKGMMLLENISESKAKQMAGIPSKIVRQEQAILSEINELQARLSNISVSEVPSEGIDSLKSIIFKEKGRYRNLIDSLEYTFPKYYNYKNKVAIVSSDDIEKLKAENQTIVSYIMDVNEGFVVLMSKGKVTLKKLDNLQALKEKITIFHGLVQTPFSSQDDRSEYKIVAYELFQMLFPFPDFQQDMLPKTLYIIPDGDLYTLPFEALICNPDGSLEDTYLISQSEVLYQYSLSVNSQMEVKLEEPPEGFVGFVPIDFSNNYLPALQNGQGEIRLLNANFKGKVFSNDLATKTAFLEEYQSNNIVHLSTHGGVDKVGPWLALFDQKLSLDELFFTANKKELVVLSACKTSLGNQARGEGVINFTRGFINAGAKSVVTSLWDINEKSSAAIIANFYENLLDGKTKASALRMSKIAYMKAHNNTSEASPSYWSGIVITGQNTPLVSTTRNTVVLWMLLLLMGAIFGYWFLQKY